MCVYTNPCIYAYLFLYVTSCIYIKCEFLLVSLTFIRYLIDHLSLLPLLICTFPLPRCDP